MAPSVDPTHPDRPVHIVFVGAGAVGCFYASRLHHPQHNIHTSLIARSNYPQLSAGGVKLQTRTFGDYTFTPHAVFPSVAAAAVKPSGDGSSSSSSSSPGPRQWDFIIVTTKALPDRGDDAALIAPLVGPSSVIVLIQNGVGVEAPYRKRYPTTPIVSAVTVVSAEQISPGTVRQNRWTRMHLGPYTDSASTDEDETGSASDSDFQDRARAELERRGTAAVEQLTAWWTALGGIRDIEASDEVGLQTVRWHKLTINAAMNPSAVLSGGRGNADMVRDPELRRHLRGIMAEIWDAAPRVLGRPFPADLAPPDKILASTERNVGSKPSMLLDWERGSPLEIEVILGNPVRIARAKGVELPRMQSLYALLSSAQRTREERQQKSKGKL